MDKLVSTYIEKAFEYEERGAGDQAITLWHKIMEKFPQERDQLLLEGAKLKYRCGYYKEALLDFMEAYALLGDESLYDLILEAYYKGNETAYQEMYKKNLQLLCEYPYFCCEKKQAEMIRILPLWKDEELVCWANISNHTFQAVKRLTLPKEESNGARIALCNEIWSEDLSFVEHNSYLKDPVAGQKLPVYYIYDEEYWECFLQTDDVGKHTISGKSVFLVGEKSVRKSFSSGEFSFPQRIWDKRTNERYLRLFSEIRSEIVEEVDALEQEITDYYAGQGDSILERLKQKKARILFWTSRFTTALQYHAGACCRAAERLGYDTRFLIEKNDISTISFLKGFREVAEFKPDIVFFLDHFRFEHGNDILPKNVICITWIQDPMPHIMDKNTPEKLIARDIVMNHFVTWKRIQEIGYQNVIDAPLPADAQVYKPYVLTKEEQEAYSCDICFVCHASDVRKKTERLAAALPSEWKERVELLCYGYQNYVYETGSPFYSQDDFCRFIAGVLHQAYGVQLNDEIFPYVAFIAREMCVPVNEPVFRQCLVDWLLDAGYTNIKLWGNGWKDVARYAPYAMGAAENGETLSKIYQASKIVIGNNVKATAAARAWESMLSGAFYMSNYIPPSEDYADIRKILKEGEELVMFHNRDDLLEKVAYYLAHEDERKQMAETGRKAALERMTFDKLMEKVLDEIPGIIKKQEKETAKKESG